MSVVSVVILGASMILAVAYAAIGILFAFPFAFAWAGRLDPVASNGTLGFRLLILPGAALLWPWLIVALARGGRAP